MQWDVLNLLVILYSSDTQYSFACFTVKTKAYNVIISHIVQLWLLFKNVIFCLNLGYPTIDRRSDSLANWHVGRVRNLFVLYCMLNSTTSLQSLGRFLWATRYIMIFSVENIMIISWYISLIYITDIFVPTLNVTFMSEVKSEYWNLWDFST